MSLNRNYSFSIDIRTGKVTQQEMKFINTDSNVCNFYVNLSRDKQKVDLTNYVITMHIIKPNGAFKTVSAMNYNATEGIIEIDLPNDCTDTPGTYAAEFLIEYDGEIVTTDTFGYIVKSSIIDSVDDDIVDNPDYSVLLDLLKEVKESKQTVQDAINMIPSKEELVGPQGPQGEPGMQGPKGDKGDVGPEGPQGPKGDTGERGPQGPEGPQGIQGPKGDAFTYSDFTSEQLEALRGPQGPAGQNGATGPQGPKGDTGAAGSNGKSLQFNWRGTELGIRQEGSAQYEYVDLIGPQGPAGTGGDGSGGSNLTANLIKSNGDYLALNEKADGSGNDIYMRHKDRGIEFYGTNKQVIARIEQNFTDPQGQLFLDGSTSPCLVSPAVWGAYGRNAYPILNNGVAAWTLSTSYEWGEPYSELNWPGTYCINAADEMWYMGENYTRKRVMTSDYLAFSLFKTEEEMTAILENRSKTKETELFPTLELLSEDFKADLDKYIQYKIDKALEAIK